MTQYYTPPYTSLFEIKGADAKGFLHRLSTLDLHSMKKGDVQSGLLLNGTGRIQSYFWISVLEENRYLIELEDEKNFPWKKLFLGTLEAMTFNEKYTLQELSSLQPIYIFEDNAFKSSLDEKKIITSEGCYWIYHCCHQFGRPWISVWGTPENLEISTLTNFPGATRIREKDTELERIQAVLPKIGHELKIDSFPLELGMKNSITTKKGCYPGQEVIERILSKGSPARRLVLLEGRLDSPLKEENQVHYPNAILKGIHPDGKKEEIGELTSLYLKNHQTVIALALVKKAFLQKEIQAEASFSLSSTHSPVHFSGKITSISQYE